MRVVLASQGLPADLKRLRREYERKRMEQVKKFQETIKKIAHEERETWFPKRKEPEPVEEIEE